MARRSSGRSSSSSRAPSRTQTRSASTTSRSQPAPYQAAPPAGVAAPQKQPGLFAQMASTAAGVAVGSTIGHTMGHALGGMFGGGSRDSPAEQEQQVPAAYSAQQSQMSSSQSQGPVCEADTKAFLSCLERSNNEIGACQFYYDMLKQCQASSGDTMRQ